MLIQSSVLTNLSFDPLFLLEHTTYLKFKLSIYRQYMNKNFYGAQNSLRRETAIFELALKHEFLS